MPWTRRDTKFTVILGLLAALYVGLKVYQVSLLNEAAPAPCEGTEL